MSTSTDGEISFGIRFDEGFEFPWGQECDDGEVSHDFGGDIEAWWRVMNGFSIKDSPYDSEGNYNPGFTEKDPRIAAYFERQREWDDAHPLPVQLVNYQSGDCAAYILAVPQSVITAYRGYPVELNISELKTNEAARKVLIDFCERFGIDCGEETPKWWLSSYWG